MIRACLRKLGLIIVAVTVTGASPNALAQGFLGVDLNGDALLESALEVVGSRLDQLESAVQSGQVGGAG